MKGNIVQEKSFAFAIRIVKLYQHLTEKKKEFVLSKQLLRSGTSIGANIEESIGGQSKADWLSKLAIAHKETRESIYWIKLLSATDYLSVTEAKSKLFDADEIGKILGKTQITVRGKFGK